MLTFSIYNGLSVRHPARNCSSKQKSVYSWEFQNRRISSNHLYLLNFLDNCSYRAFERETMYKNTVIFMFLPLSLLPPFGGFFIILYCFQFLIITIFDIFLIFYDNKKDSNPEGVQVLRLSNVAEERLVCIIFFH